MRDFDPGVPSVVHDQRTNRVFVWSPKWEDVYLHRAKSHSMGVVEFDGLALDGWTDIPEGKPS
jgi:hypothetical protein